jgi:hypothetical protein
VTKTFTGADPRAACWRGAAQEALTVAADTGDRRAVRAGRLARAAWPVRLRQVGRLGLFPFSLGSTTGATGRRPGMSRMGTGAVGEVDDASPGKAIPDAHSQQQMITRMLRPGLAGRSIRQARRPGARVWRRRWFFWPERRWDGGMMQVLIPRARNRHSSGVRA